MIDKVLNLLKEAFPEDSEKFLKELAEENFENIRYIYDDVNGDLICILFLIYKDIKISANIHNIPYLVAFACDKRYRSKGYAFRLLDETLKELILAKVPCIMLYPFSHKYYRQYGFETVSYTDKIKISKDSSCILEETDDAKRVLRIYNDVLRDKNRISYTLDSMRHKMNKNILSDDKTYVVTKDGIDVGFLNANKDSNGILQAYEPIILKDSNLFLSANISADAKVLSADKCLFNEHCMMKVLDLDSYLSFFNFDLPEECVIKINFKRINNEIKEHCYVARAGKLINLHEINLKAMHILDISEIEILSLISNACVKNGDMQFLKSKLLNFKDFNVYDMY